MKQFFLGAALALVLSLEARAIDAFNAQSLEPPADPFGYATVQGGKTLAPGDGHVALYDGWARRPVGPVRDLHRLDLVGGVGLASLHEGGVEVGADLPLALLERRRDESDPDWDAGDLRTDVKLNPFDRDLDFFGLGARAWVDWPTGRTGRFSANDGAFAAGAEAIVEGRIDWLRGSLNIGWEWLDGSFDGGGPRVDDRLRLGAAIAISPLRDLAGFEPLEVLVEATHWTLAGRPWDGEEVSPVELGGAIKWSGKLFGLVGAGGQLNDGVGAPAVRLWFAVGSTF